MPDKTAIEELRKAWETRGILSVTQMAILENAAWLVKMEKLHYPINSHMIERSTIKSAIKNHEQRHHPASADQPAPVTAEWPELTIWAGNICILEKNGAIVGLESFGNSETDECMKIKNELIRCYNAAHAESEAGNEV